jgi:hypothetical protein
MTAHHRSLACRSCGRRSLYRVVPQALRLLCGAVPCRLARKAKWVKERVDSIECSWYGKSVSGMSGPVQQSAGKVGSSYRLSGICRHRSHYADPRVQILINSVIGGLKQTNGPGSVSTSDLRGNVVKNMSPYLLHDSEYS